MECFVCKGSMTPSTTTYFAELKNCMIIVKNVPCLKCDQCGEEFFNGTVIGHLEEVMATAEQLASELLIIEYDHKAA